MVAAELLVKLLIRFDLVMVAALDDTEAAATVFTI